MSKNIIWQKPDETLAITSILVDDIDSKKHAKELIESGIIDPNWVAKLFDLDDIPEGDHELLRIKSKKVILLESSN